MPADGSWMDDDAASSMDAALGDAGSDAGHEDAGDDGDVLGEGPDSDGDGLSDSAEAEYGTDPRLPDSDGDGLSDGDEVRLGSDPLDPDSDDDGFTDNEEVLLGTDPKSDDAAEGCAAQEAQSSETMRPVDIVVIVDNSSSMDGEIIAIQERINEDFGAILDTAGVDWRVILLSRHGAIGHDINSCDDNGICIYGDLAGGSAMCDPHAAPADTERFKHYSVCIDSEDGLAKAAASFDQSPPDWPEVSGFERNRYFNADQDPQDLDTAPSGWHGWLRPQALRTFLMISDDKSDVTDQEFMTWLYSKDASYFGTAQNPNWVFHSIIAVQAKPDATEPWLASEPLITQNCGAGSQEIGDDYQRLSIASGGLRFPICANGNFDAVFQAIAQTVVESSSVPCTLVPRAVPGAGPPDFERIAVIYDSGEGTRTNLSRVAEAPACDGGDYYVTDAHEIQLCPATCMTVESDSAARIRLRVACAPVCGNGVLEAGEECDDGNTDGGDACSPSCAFENLCGNSSVDPWEECDDGNLQDGDGCSAGCGVEGGCGDGERGDEEECDDGNLQDGDGCSASCDVEQGCGDGTVQAGEQCDDDNLIPGDGCDAQCRVEVVPI